MSLEMEIPMRENVSKADERGDIRKGGGQGSEQTYWSKKSGDYRHKLKNAVANFLRNLREHLHDVHSDGR